jgi:hypothetical protein
MPYRLKAGPVLHIIAASGPQHEVVRQGNCDSGRCISCQSRIQENRIGRCHRRIYDSSGVALLKQCDKSIEGPVHSLSQRHITSCASNASGSVGVVDLRLTSVLHGIVLPIRPNSEGRSNALDFSISIDACLKIEYGVSDWDAQGCKEKS